MQSVPIIGDSLTWLLFQRVSVFGLVAVLRVMAIFSSCVTINFRSLTMPTNVLWPRHPLGFIKGLEKGKNKMLIPAGTKLKAKSVSDEVRDFLGKDGTTKVKRRVVNIASVDKEGDWIKITSFDPSWPIPSKGQEFELPPVKRLECFDGIMQNVMV